VKPKSALRVTAAAAAAAVIAVAAVVVTAIADAVGIATRRGFFLCSAPRTPGPNRLGVDLTLQGGPL
jgi:hypothetical protein